MKPGRLSYVIPAIAIGALGVGVAGTAAATGLTGAQPATASPSARTAASTKAAAGGPTVVFNCVNQAQVRPRSFILTCADANAAVTGLTWANWTPSQARATGTEQENTCTPDCAQGTIRSYPARVTLWRAEPAAHGQGHFTRMTIHYPGARPPVYNGNGKQVPGPRTRTVDLWG